MRKAHSREVEIRHLTHDNGSPHTVPETFCHDTYAAHVHFQLAPIRGPQEAGKDANVNLEMSRALEAFRSELVRIVEHTGTFTGIQILNHEARFHVVFYRPVYQAQKMAIRAILLQMYLRSFLDEVIAAAFPLSPRFHLATGADIGFSIATEAGTSPASDLVFLGFPVDRSANLAQGGPTDYLTEALYAELPQNLRLRLKEIDDRVEYGRIFEVQGLRRSEIKTILANYRLWWDYDLITDDKAPLRRSSAELETCESSRSVIVPVAVVEGTIEGLTAMVESTALSDSAREPVRYFHLIRREIEAAFAGNSISFFGATFQIVAQVPASGPESCLSRLARGCEAAQSRIGAVLGDYASEGLLGVTWAVCERSAFLQKDEASGRIRYSVLPISTDTFMASQIDKVEELPDVNPVEGVHDRLPAIPESYPVMPYGLVVELQEQMTA